MFRVSCGTCGSKSCRCRTSMSPGSIGFISTGLPKFRKSPISTGLPSARSVPTVVPPDPNPFRFTIIRHHSEKGYTLLKIYYHGCTNYEGMKILLVHKEIGEIRAMDGLDPHFLCGHENALIARFVPTEEGWKLGMNALKLLTENES